MSLLKKLKKKVGKTTEIVRDTVKDPTAAQAEQQNAAFRLLTANYVLLQKVLRARDIVYIQKRNPATGAIYNAYEEEMDRLVANQVKAMEESDSFFRNQFLVNAHDVTDIDVLAQYFYEVIDGMELMSVNDLEVLTKVVRTILSDGRYMHIDSEEGYLDTLLKSAQNGMELAKKGRKTVTMNDIKRFVKPIEKK